MCPNCHHPKSRVDETRRIGSTTWRWRECLNCKARFWTTEMVSETAPRTPASERDRSSYLPVHARTPSPHAALQ